MSWLRTANAKPTFTTLQIGTSTSTLPIPIVWGTAKVSTNVLFYANFQVQNPNGGKGGLFQTGSATDYSCDIIMGLCEGPIGGIGTIWRDQSTYTLGDLGLSLFEGNTPQAVWGYLQSTYPNQALAYQGTAYVCAANYKLGSEADVGNHNFEVQGFFATSGFNGVDANPAEVIFDFLTNPQYGAGFDASAINLNTLYGPENGGDSSLESYCSAMGISISPCLTSAEQGSAVLSRWLQILNCAAYMTQGELNFVPFCDQTIAAGKETISVIATVPNPGTTTVDNNDDDIVNITPTISICSEQAFVSDGGIVYTFTGAALSYTGTNPPPSAGEYTISPNGTYLFNPNDEGQSLTITYSYTRSVSFVPNLTPIYSLADRDFVTDDDKQKDPVIVSRLDPFSLPNIQRIEVLSRANQYAGTPVEARDQSQIELYGPRVGSTITAHEICDEIFTAPLVVQAILQRGLYVRATFKFKVSWEYCLLDPMDIVLITDVNLGLSAYPARIISIDEDDKGLLAITAEELTVGVSTPVRYQTDSARGFLPNRSKTADPVNAPLIYEPPPGLTNNDPEIWLGASGGLNGVSDPNWGGCNVYISFDGTTYSSEPFATINKRLRQGVLTANLAAADGWDTDDTLAINVAESAAVFSGTSEASAQAGATLSLIDGELLAFETATLTSANHYNLTGLQRGLYGTAAASHSTGAQFSRLDAAIVKQKLPAAYIGQPLYFKFQSFNVFGAGDQLLSSVTPYAYAPSGAGIGHPILSLLSLGIDVNLGSLSGVTDNLASGPSMTVSLDS